MAWPATVNPGDTATASQYNALVAALKTWGGAVNGGNYALTNVSNLSVGSGGIALAGGLTLPVREVTADTVLTAADYAVIAYPGATKITLPASPVNGQTVLVRNNSGGLLTVDGNGKTVAGAGSSLLNAGVIFQYDTAQSIWQVMAAFGINQPGLTGLTKDLVAASASVLGGVKQGVNVAIAGDGTLTVPYSAHRGSRVIAQAPAAYNVTATDYIIQVSLGDGTNSNINFPAGQAGDTYIVCVIVAANSTTATLTCPGGFYFNQGTATTFKVYCGQSCVVTCIDGNDWLITDIRPSQWMTWTPTLTGDAGVTFTAPTVQTNLWRADVNEVEILFYIDAVNPSANTGKIVMTLPIAVATNGIGGSTYCIPSGSLNIDHLTGASATNEHGFIMGNAGAANCNMYPNNAAGTANFRVSGNFGLRGSLRYPFR